MHECEQDPFVDNKEEAASANVLMLPANINN